MPVGLWPSQLDCGQTAVRPCVCVTGKEERGGKTAGVPTVWGRGEGFEAWKPHPLLALLVPCPPSGNRRWSGHCGWLCGCSGTSPGSCVPHVSVAVDLRATSARCYSCVPWLRAAAAVRQGVYMQHQRGAAAHLLLDTMHCPSLFYTCASHFLPTTCGRHGGGIWKNGGPSPQQQHVP
eukprot:326496-Chlamydomonas_euryale.AAC.2